jgi:hypothetical protein
VQETRHIMAAISQQITYNEFLPMVLGKEVMHQHDLILLKEGYFDGYDRYHADYTVPKATFDFIFNNEKKKHSSYGMKSFIP